MYVVMYLTLISAIDRNVFWCLINAVSIPITKQNFVFHVLNSLYFAWMRIVCFSVSFIDSGRFIWTSGIYEKVEDEPGNKAAGCYKQIFMEETLYWMLQLLHVVVCYFLFPVNLINFKADDQSSVVSLSLSTWFIFYRRRS